MILVMLIIIKTIKFIIQIIIFLILTILIIIQIIIIFILIILIIIKIKIFINKKNNITNNIKIKNINKTYNNIFNINNNNKRTQV